MNRKTMWVATLVCALSVGCGGAMKANRAEEKVEEAREKKRESSGPEETGSAPSIKARPSQAEAIDVESSGFEGDTFDEDEDEVREEVDGLVAELEQLLEHEALQGPKGKAPRGCQEVCEVSEAICESSGRICDISEANPSDAYIHDRCRWSERECRDANSRCSVCEP
ncbi:MAG: hypothetical protein CMH57_13745 [Myxococcales bacterium]|nr:hypothetical protein [Myxococcales bacterium]